MSTRKKTLFEDDEDIPDDVASAPTLRVNESYSSHYDSWRAKEELQKLKDRYGSDVESDSSDSSSSDDGETSADRGTEEDFLRTLSILKKKDPRVYDASAQFYRPRPTETRGSDDISTIDRKKSKRAPPPLTVSDYEILLAKRGGAVDDDEDATHRRDASLYDEHQSARLTYDDEQRKLKDAFKEAATSGTGEEESLLRERTRTEEEHRASEADYSLWLKGQRKEPPTATTKDAAADMQHLRSFWSSAELDDGEKFLRDYILERRYLEDADRGVESNNQAEQAESDDEADVERQELFEHKYNFRFEEPDADFIKRHPRTVADSLRRADDRRTSRRQEVKDRKEAASVRRREEIKQLKNLKRREIEEQLERIRRATGNDKLGLNVSDINDDFDPEQYDRRMSELFGGDYYGEAEGERPALSDESDIEDWDRWQPSTGASDSKSAVGTSKFAEALAKSKPQFDPTAGKTLEQHIDEYYQLDCEDMIGDMPCHFRYRKVMPAAFALTAEEILLAPERELNAWASLKKITQYRSEEEEQRDAIAYARKGRVLSTKRKKLPSLYDAPDVDHALTADNPMSEQSPRSKEVKKVGKISGKKRQRIRKFRQKQKSGLTETHGPKATGGKALARARKRSQKDSVIAKSALNAIPAQSSRKRKTAVESPSKTAVNEPKLSTALQLSDTRLEAYGINAKKFRNKMKYGAGRT